VAARLSKGEAPSGTAPGDYRFVVTHWTFEAIRPLEQLWFGVESCSAGGEALHDDAAERFVMAVLERAAVWAGVSTDFDLESVADDLEQGLLVVARDRFEQDASRVRAENEDRADAQLRGIETHLAQQRAKYEKQRQQHLDEGRPGLARAQEVALEKLEARIGRQSEAVNSKRQVREELRELCVGVVRVE
jgi:hypothetical protein